MSRDKRHKRRVAAPAAVLSAWALAGGAALGAPAAAAATPAVGPSGIGLATGGPQVLASSAYYAKALTSPDWTSTPDGLVYDSCVSQIPRGGTLDAVHNEIILASGATQKIPSCPYPRLVQSATMVAAPTAIKPDAAAPTTDNVVGDWDDIIGTGDSFSQLRVEMAVPNSPAGVVPTVTDYIFSGLDAGNPNDVREIDANLFVTVGYGYTRVNETGTVSGDYLWTTPYYTWGNNAAIGTILKVKAGDTILGGITATSPRCTDNCSWVVTTQDLSAAGKPQSKLQVYSAGAYQYIYDAALETNTNVPGTPSHTIVPYCPGLFRGGHAAFRHETAETTNGATQQPWPIPPLTELYPSGFPCYGQLKAAGTSVDLWWERVQDPGAP